MRSLWTLSMTIQTNLWAQPVLQHPCHWMREARTTRLNLALQRASLRCHTICANQISSPVVVEIFCGSARLTSCIKSLGMTASFGVDHKLDKVVATAKQLDLTLPEHQQTLFMWLRSPLVVGVFLAPPCGTASLARTIQLRDSRGRAIAGPRPLRSAASPEGLPNLTFSRTSTGLSCKHSL